MAGRVTEVIECCKSVRSMLGPHFSEAVYHRSLEVELRRRYIPYESEIPVAVTYKGFTVGNVRVDVFVDKQVVVELKATPSGLNSSHVAQTEKYMTLLGVAHGLVVNMGKVPELDYHRVISAGAS